MMMGPKLTRSACIVLSVAALVACANKEPKGQVVALVDGEEVTRRDLATEPTSRQAQGDEAQPAILHGVIDRKLAASEARRLQLDRTPEYVAQARRLEEVMLSRTLFERWAAELPAAPPKAIADYIARNPQRFGQRKLFLVDRIEAGVNAMERQALEPLQTNDAVAQQLRSRSQPFQRGQAVLDSASLSMELTERLRALPKRYPLAMAEGEKLVVLAVLETRDAALPKEEQAASAMAALKQVAVQDKLASLRKTAKIAYQPGYRPAATEQ
jgi:EpsD family peptidyl-prolyl cis-trans isomerase